MLRVCMVPDRFEQQIKDNLCSAQSGEEKEGLGVPAVHAAASQSAGGWQHGGVPPAEGPGGLIPGSR